MKTVSERLFKHWMTTIIGLVIMAMGVYYLYLNLATLTLEKIMFGSVLVAVGFVFFFVKDKVIMKWAGKTTVLLLIISLSVSCRTISKATTTTDKQVVKDSVKSETVTKVDTAGYKKTPGKTAEVKGIDASKNSQTTITNGGLSVDITVTDGKINAVAKQAEDSVPVLRQNTTTNNSNTHSSNNNHSVDSTEKVVDEPFVNGWFWVYAGVAVAIIISVIIYKLTH